MRVVLLLSCPDRPGIVAAVGGFVADIGGNIIAADQHSDEGSDGDVTFLQRVEFDAPDPLPDLLGGPGSGASGGLAEAFAPVARSFDMGYTVHVAGPPAASPCSHPSSGTA